jgi:hypothetical protein
VEFIFFSPLSEFENFPLCERILINVTLVKTKRQTNFKDFKKFGARQTKKRCIWHPCQKKAQFTHELVK